MPRQLVLNLSEAALAMAERAFCAKHELRGLLCKVEFLMASGTFVQEAL